MKKRVEHLLYFIKSHIWIQIAASIILISSILLLIFFFYLRTQYYNHLLSETEESNEVVLSAASSSLNNQIASQLLIGGGIAVDSELYEMVHGIKNEQFHMTASDHHSLKDKLKKITDYSDDIIAITVVTNDGLLYEFGDWYSSSKPGLWVGSNLPILEKIYFDVMENLKNKDVGYYQVATEPSKRNADPSTRIFHIGFPLIGSYLSLSKVEAVIVVTYKFVNIVKSGALLSGDSSNYTYRYLTEKNGNIIFHENDQFIGSHETELLSNPGIEVLSSPLEYFNWHVNIAIDRDAILQRVKNIYLKSTFVYMIAIFFAALAWTVTLRKILHPIDTIKQSMVGLEMGEQKKVEIHGKNEIWQLAAEYNKMLDALQAQYEIIQKDYHEKVEMSERRIEAERTALESQINAHFIFNTLNVIHLNATETGDAETADLIKRLSTILRYTMSQQREVTIGDEFDISLQYLYLQKYRLMDKFDYEIHFSEEYSEWPCCKMFLQPFIENSIVHGFAGMDAGGKIRIKGFEYQNRFCIEIEDNGRGMTEEEYSYVKNCLSAEINLDLKPGNRGIAIRNVLLRARMFFGKDFDARLESKPGKGTKLTFKLPIPKGMRHVKNEVKKDANNRS